MEADLLRLFLNHPLEYWSHQKLCNTLSLSELHLNSFIANLNQWGFIFDSHPSLGIRLISLPESFHTDELVARLPENFPWKVTHVKETSSTMDFVKREGLAGAPHGYLVIADSQSQGRGRLGRSWQSSPQKGLYLSVLVRPSYGVENYSKLTIITALATALAVEKMISTPIQIKWPNDLYHQKLKFCGILTEAHQDKNKNYFAVIGMGLNLTHRNSDFSPEILTKATSLYNISGKIIRKTEFLSEWIMQFEKGMRSPFESSLEQWTSRCFNLGEAIKIETANETIEGTATQIESDGTLTVRTDSGVQRSVQSGVLIY